MITWVAAVWPISASPFCTLLMTSAPRSAPTIVPRPPNRLVPPITAAAMALSVVLPPPVFTDTEKLRDALRTPATAARVDTIVKITIRSALTRTPVRRDASAFPPTA